MAHHSAALRAASRDERILEVLESGDDAQLSPRERALVVYARALTSSPAGVREADVHRLRDVGLGDDGVLHAAQIVAYFNFVNRLAEGLGVTLEMRS